ncbi:MAG: ComEA family DNA-binding protein [Coriobacteriales bacterium]|jgi:competence protein ComEA|nr:ComEA family DNA-binding protein [Coriobacteriales bacterium]
MKGCTDYTDEATRWRGNGGERRRSRLKLLVIGALGIAAALAAFTFWPRQGEEGLVVASAQESPAATPEGGAPDGQAGALAGLPGRPEGALGSAQGGLGATAQAGDAAVQGAGGGEAASAAKAAAEELTVYVTGAVAEPGVYVVGQGARINDAVKDAGGLSQDAAANYVNLAAPLQDGQHVHIPDLAQVESGEATLIAAGASSGDPLPQGQAEGQDAPEAQGGSLVNINTADSAALESLPGIGPATAKRIIDHREKNGAFASIEGLKDVSGIGEKKYEELAGKVCV